MPIISVVVPVYNVESFLNQCVDSILRQSFKDFELILVDDGSTDSSANICDEYANTDCRIRVFHKKNEKQGTARNFGVSCAKSDLICFIDSDDFVDQNYLEILYNTYLKSNNDIICCNFIEGADNYSFCETTDKLETTEINITDEKMAQLYKNHNYYWVCHCKLIKKTLAINNPFPGGVYYEDNSTVFKWIFNSKKITLINKTLYFYRINRTGTTKGTNNHIMDYVNALEEQVSFLFDIHYSITANLAIKEYLKLTTHLYYTKEKRTNDEAKCIKEKVSYILSKYGPYLTNDDIYGNRVIHPLVSYIYRIKRKIKK